VEFGLTDLLNPACQGR